MEHPEVADISGKIRFPAVLIRDGRADAKATPAIGGIDPDSGIDSGIESGTAGRTARWRNGEMEVSKWR